MFMNNLALLAICLMLIILISGCVAPIDKNTEVNKIKNSTSSSLLLTSSISLSQTVSMREIYFQMLAVWHCS